MHPIGIVYNSAADGSGIVAGFRIEHYFYAGWRVVEVTNWDPSAFGDYDHTTADVLGQFVYGTQYVDEPVRYDRNLDVGTNDSCIGGGGEGASSDASYYYHQDANYRVIAVTDEAGNVVERYDYTAYGDTLVLGGYDAAAGAELGNRRLTSVVGNPLQHQGLFRDRETGTYQNRFRQYHPRLGRFVQRDPLGYVDGMGLYEYIGSNPTLGVDPAGTTYVPPGIGWILEWLFGGERGKPTPTPTNAPGSPHGGGPRGQEDAGNADGAGDDDDDYIEVGGGSTTAGDAWDDSVGRVGEAAKRLCKKGGPGGKEVGKAINGYCKTGEIIIRAGERISVCKAAEYALNEFAKRGARHSDRGVNMRLGDGTICAIKCICKPGGFTVHVHCIGYEQAYVVCDGAGSTHCARYCNWKRKPCNNP